MTGMLPAKRYPLQIMLLPICVPDVPPLVILVFPTRIDADPSEQLVLSPTIVPVFAIAPMAIRTPSLR